MEDNARLLEIRENEKKSHIAMYSQSELYKDGGWLSKPIKTVVDLLSCFDARAEIKVLDLGCGIGRNAIAIADYFRSIKCEIDCVDILELAIEKLEQYSMEKKVSEAIRGFVTPIEDFTISKEHYDWILAVSSLEHVDSEGPFLRKLEEIKSGIRKNGIVCLVLNSDIEEFVCATHSPCSPQFEVNLPSEKMQGLLERTFYGWSILKATQRKQKYEIPRGEESHIIQTTVVTFVACKTE